MAGNKNNMDTTCSENCYTHTYTCHSPSPAQPSLVIAQPEAEIVAKMRPKSHMKKHAITK